MASRILRSASRSLEPDETVERDALARRTEQRNRLAVREEVLVAAAACDFAEQVEVAH